jgi:hypothetical protein
VVGEDDLDREAMNLAAEILDGQLDASTVPTPVRSAYRLFMS